MDAVRGPRARALPWVACDLPLEPGINGIESAGRVTGLSMDAVRLERVDGLAEGTEVRLGFRLPGQKGPTVITGRVVAPDPAAGVVDVAIETFEGDGKRLYQRFLNDRVQAEAKARHLASLLADNGSLTRLSSPHRIRDIFADAVDFRADVLVHQPEGRPPLRGRLASVTDDELIVDMEGSAAGTPNEQAGIRCSVSSRHGPYLFETRVRARRDRRLSLSIPEQLHQYEKRSEPRVAISAPAGPAPAPSERKHVGLDNRVLIPLPVVYGGTIERPLIDLSQSGVAFRSLPGDPLFLPGTPLAGVVIVRDGRPSSPRTAEVRQVAADNTSDEEGAREGTFRVGIALDIERAPVAAAPAAAKDAHGALGWLTRVARAARRPLDAARSRLLVWRRPAPGAGPIVTVVRYRGREREEIVALLNTTRPPGSGSSRLRGPLVVIPPPFGRTKETFGALAVMLAETFRRAQQDAVIVRYDGVRSVGESHKDPEDWAEGRHMMQYTLSQGAADLLATVEHFHTRPWFRPTQTVVISFSLASLAARRAILDDRKDRISHWISVVGAVDAQDVLYNVTGGIDLIGGYQGGVRHGVMPVLGHMGDVDGFAADAIAAGLASLSDARRDLARIRLPVTWFIGRDDRWIRAERVHDALSIAAPARREVVELPVGHTMRSSEEALQSFEKITRHLWGQLFGPRPVEVRLDPDSLKRVLVRERGRLPRRRLGDARRYWEDYLLGEDHGGLGLDLWATTPAYRELMELQRQLLDVSEGDVVADLGAGTGNFTEHLLDRLVRSGLHTSPKRIIAADLVPRALAIARRKAQAVLDGVLLPSDFLEFREIDLSTSRLRPIRRFLAGELSSIEALRGVIDGLSDETLDQWLLVYDHRLHAWLRGAAPDGPMRAALGRMLRSTDLAVALEFNRAARWILGRLGPEDVRSDDRARALSLLAEPRRLRAEHLRFDHLRLDGPGLDDALPLEDASVDKVILSLVISYLPDPVEVLREVHRIIRPEGRVVASGLRPDADLSRTVEELIGRVAKDDAVARRFGLSSADLARALQQYLNHAAGLVELEEDGVFRFLSRDDMARLFEEAGFDQVTVHESFGRPPQAFVAVGVKR